METNPTSPNPAELPSQRPLRVKLFGVGEAGVKVTQLLVSMGFPAECIIAVDSDAASLRSCVAAQKKVLSA